MNTRKWLLIFFVLFLLTVLALYWSGARPRLDLSTLQFSSTAELAARGKVYAESAGCIDCHTDPAPNGAMLAGGRVLDTQFGRFVSTNITADKLTGIGAWSPEEFVTALRYGLSPTGMHYFPAFPYTSFTKMRTDDLVAIYEYLRSVPPIRRFNQKQRPRWYLWRGGLRFWKRLYFRPGVLEPDPLRPAQWNRGSYLVNAVVHCGECHTPRNRLGALNVAYRFAGTDGLPGGEKAPNITASRDAGIGYWSQQDLKAFLRTGIRPDGSTVNGLMREVIDNSLSALSDADLDAIVVYVKSVPAIN